MIFNIQVLDLLLLLQELAFTEAAAISPRLLQTTTAMERQVAGAV
jgi:hypothetical protein